MKPTRFTIILAVVLLAVSVQAQSGRRHTKPPPAAPVPTPTPEPSPSATPQDKESEISFYLGADRGTAFVSFPWAYYSAVLQGCAERLRAGSSANVDFTERHLSRGEAIEKAKAETKTYVVLLTLVADSMTNRNQSSYGDLELDFVVFAPQTAKVVISGRTYPNANRRGPLVVGPTRGPAGGIYRERLLNEAGEDAANRILKALNLNVPVRK